MNIYLNNSYKGWRKDQDYFPFNYLTVGSYTIETKMYEFNGDPELPTLTDDRYSTFTVVGVPPSAPQGVTISGTVGQHPTVSWSANGEANLSGYKVYRKIDPDEESFSLIATRTTSQTSYTDQDVTIRTGGTAGQYAIYYVKAYNQIDLLSEASSTVYKAVNYNMQKRSTPNLSSEDRSTPKEYSVSQNYPNPFNPTTTLSFDLPEPSQVVLTVYDHIGREVATVVNGYRSAGHFEATFDASNLGSGVYFYRLQAGSYTAVKKMLLIK